MTPYISPTALNVHLHHIVYQSALDSLSLLLPTAPSVNMLWLYGYIVQQTEGSPGGQCIVLVNNGHSG